MALVGANGMFILSGERVNFGVYRQLKSGVMVRLAGRFRSAGVLTTTDVGRVMVEWAWSETLSVGPECFVEVVGKKMTNERMQAVCIVKLPGVDVDQELWNESIMLAQRPDVRHLFEPSKERSISVEQGMAEVQEQELMSETQEYGSQAHPGESLRCGVDDGRGFPVTGAADGVEQEVLSPTEMLAERSERDTFLLEAELDVMLRGGVLSD